MHGYFFYFKIDLLFSLTLASSDGSIQSLVGFWNVIDVSQENYASFFRNELNHIEVKISCYRWIFEFTETTKIFSSF